jgi:protein-tyrosine phosphatase
VRALSWPDLRNARDLGGLRTAGGRTTRAGALVRSDTPARLVPAGWERLLAYGVRTMVDLREASLVAEERYVAPARIARHHMPLVPPTFPLPVPVRGGYEMALDQGQATMVEVARVILSAPAGAVLFHCHSGTGRTGTVAAVLLALLEVPAADIAADYEASHDLPDAAAAAVAPALLAHLESAHGGAAAYLRSGGLSDHEMDGLRARMTA